MLTHIPGAAGRVESELLHTYSRVDPFDVLILCVRVAVLTAVTLTVPIVLFPVSVPLGAHMGHPVASPAHLQAVKGETEAAVGRCPGDRMGMGRSKRHR